MALVCLRDYEKKAADLLQKDTLEYYRDGAGHGATLNNNQACFQKLRLRPKCLQDVSKMDITTTVLGCDMSYPVGIASTAFQELAHPEGELATARAAENAGVIYVQSSVSSYSIEEVCQAAPNGTKWLQVNSYTDKRFTGDLVRRAEKNGYKAIILTIDQPVCPANVLYTLKRMRSFTSRRKLKLNNFNSIAFEGTRVLDKAVSWADVKKLIEFTKLPVLVKGILRADDAAKAVEAGVQGIIVSNHGARLVDTAPATIEALPEIVEAVAGRVPVMLDGGVSLGSDVIKALALGADMVFIGRPILWGLTVGGQEGVESVLNLLKNEFETTLMLCGTPTIKRITKDLVVHESYYTDKLIKALKM